MKQISSTIILLLLIAINTLYAQHNKATVKGEVIDQRGNPVSLVNIAPVGIPGGATTDEFGIFSFQTVTDQEITLNASFVGFTPQDTLVTLKAGEQFVWNITLTSQSQNLDMVTIEDKAARASTISRLNPKNALVVTSPSGEGIITLIKSQPGVSSNNEMSSQYSVRGGNFDENLVYVNDIEIYRPFLVKTGQQEGLPFINSNLVSSVLFSAGGFDASYGDKMASVLDVTYKKPQDFGASIELSLLGASLSVEGATKNKKVTYLVGARQKSNQYLLNSLQTEGDYKPSFTDVQSYITYEPNEKWEHAFLGYYSRNRYQLTPSTRETDFGTVQEAYRLTVYFDGKEVNKYNNYMGALSTTYKPNHYTKLKLIASCFQTNETETYDVRAQYWIGQLENEFGNSNFGDATASEGVGTNLNHARNRLYATVASLKHVGDYTSGRSQLKWGARFQYEHVEDHVNEWEMIDSAGYSIPRPEDQIGATNPNAAPLELTNSVRADHLLISNRTSAFLMNSWNFEESGVIFTLGGRVQYWNVNNQLLFSPRASLAYTPDWKRDVLFRISGGWYAQAPFYREMRNPQGELNTDLKAQESIQIVLGSDLNFKMWDRPFKFVTEAYYKDLDNLVSYTVDNVSIRYSGENDAVGYAYGLDLKLNGEFVPGVDSWVTLSYLKTEEDIINDYFYNYYNAEGTLIVPGYTVDNTPTDSSLVEPGYIPRPTDQRLNFSLFFQDYIPSWPSWKVNLNIVFSTGLPTGPPDSEKYEQTLRMPAYKRVDIGFMKQLIGENSKFGPKSPFRNITEAWISLEVFNLLQFSNTISYLWINDVSGRQYAIPNYLTPRQVNLKLVVRI